MKKFVALLLAVLMVGNGDVFMDKRHYVYLLRCADGSLYTGMTPDIARRLRQHVERLPGCAKYTRSHPVTALALLLTMTPPRPPGSWRRASSA